MKKKLNQYWPLLIQRGTGKTTVVSVFGFYVFWRIGEVWRCPLLRSQKTGNVTLYAGFLVNSKAVHGFEVWRTGNWIICYRFADDNGWRWSFGLI